MGRIEDCFGKKYKLESSENFDEFMKAFGVGLILRKVGNAVSPVLEVSECNGEYTVKSTSAFKNYTVTFRLNESFEQELPDGRKVTSTVTLEGEDTLVELQEGGGKPCKIVRIFSADEIKMILTVDDIVCTRIYKVVEN